MHIESLDQLRTIYPCPKERAVMKQLPSLDVHCRRFISLSPFVVMASSGATGAMDASPRGGAPGFVQVIDATRLLIPDAPGNNRLDTLENIVATGRIGLLFIIPGIDETLRINGSARLSTHDEVIDRCADDKRRPQLVVDVQVQEAYLHCAKAFMRSHLWSASAQVKRDVMPTMGDMIGDQTGMASVPESQEAMLARYRADL